MLLVHDFTPVNEPNLYDQDENDINFASNEMTLLFWVAM
jgi:hypothetical protein